MSKYPLDEFDSIVPSGRKGAHRRQAGGMSQTAAITLIAVLAIVALLLVYGAVRIINSSAVDPEGQVTEPQATSTPTPANTAVAVTEHEGSVQVLNASGVPGAGAAAAEKLEAAGWSDVVSETGQSASSISVVYYASGFEEEAQALADELGVEEIEESSSYETDLTLLLNSDIARDIAESATAGASDSATPAGTTTDESGSAARGAGAGAGSGAGAGAGGTGSGDTGVSRSGGASSQTGSRGGTGSSSKNSNGSDNDPSNNSGGGTEPGTSEDDGTTSGPDPEGESQGDSDVTVENDNGTGSSTRGEENGSGNGGGDDPVADTQPGANN